MSYMKEYLAAKEENLTEFVGPRDAHRIAWDAKPSGRITLSAETISDLYNKAFHHGLNDVTPKRRGTRRTTKKGATK